MGFCNCSMFCYAFLSFHSSFAMILMGKRELESWLLFVFLAYRDCCVAFPHGATGLSAVCDCGIYRPYSLIILLICHLIHVEGVSS